MYFCVASPPTYRSRFPGNKQTYGFGCFHLKVSLRWRRQRLSFVKTFRTTNRRVDYVHWHAPRAVRLHYMKLVLSSRLRDICITHCWEHRARPPAALENELSTRMSIQAKIKALDFEIPVHASNQNSLLWSYRLICLGHLILS